MAACREISEKNKKAASSGTPVLHPGAGDFSTRGSRSSQGLVTVSPQTELTSVGQNRVGTATKRISLTAVRRKQEIDSQFSVEPDLDWREFTRSNSSLRFGSVRSYSSLSRDSSQNDSCTGFKNEELDWSGSKHVTCMNNSAEVFVTSVKDMSLSEKSSLPQNQPVSAVENNKSDDDDEEDSDGDTDEDENTVSPEDKVRKAPTELLVEFLGCVMKKDFMNAEKLCRMILIYEPKNPEALLFHPVIMEKIQLDEVSAEDEEDANNNVDSGDEEEDDDDEEEDDDDDSDSDSSSSDAGDDDEAEDDEIQPPRPDSGIGM